jgi:phospholipid transport system substrate-binding protein
MLVRKSLSIITALLLLASAATAAFAEDTSAIDTLRVAVDSVIEVLSNDQLDNAKRRELVVVKVRETFDFTAMSRFIVGKHWRKASEEQRTAFVDHFTRILEHTYIGRIEAYSDEKVQYISEKRKKNKAKIETVVVSGNAEIPISYKLYLKGTQWFVYDVSVEGVSLVRNYKDTYAGIIRKDGFDGLLDKMSKKVDEMDAGEEG